MDDFKRKKFETLGGDEKIGLMFDLISAFRIVRNPYETALFLQDLLTANEIRNLSVRLRIAKQLLAGKKHREIQDELHTSLTTITKVRAWLDEGGNGFKKVVAKLPLKWEMPKKLPRGPIEFHLPQTLMALSQYGMAGLQDRRTIKFIEGVENKRKLDRELRKMSDEYYKEEALEKRHQKAKDNFLRKIS